MDCPVARVHLKFGKVELDCDLVVVRGSADTLFGSDLPVSFGMPRDAITKAEKAAKL